MTDQPQSDVMTIGQAAAYLKLSKDTLYKYASEKKVPGFKLGNRWRFTKTQLDSWMQSQIEQQMR